MCANCSALIVWLLAVPAGAQETQEPTIEILAPAQPSVRVTASSTTGGSASGELFSGPQLLTDLLNADVMLVNDELAGEVTNLVIGPRGMIQYVVATHRGLNYLIPFRALDFDAAERVVRLPLNPSQFDEVVFFEDRNLPDLTSAAVRRQMSALFGVRAINTARATGTPEDIGLGAATPNPDGSVPPAPRTRPATGARDETPTATDDAAVIATPRAPIRVESGSPQGTAGGASPSRPRGAARSTAPRVESGSPQGTAGGASPSRPGGAVPSTAPRVESGNPYGTAGGARTNGSTSNPASRFPNSQRTTTPPPRQTTPGGPPLAPPANVTPNSSPNTAPQSSPANSGTTNGTTAPRTTRP
jgi:hypothetical protein